VAIDHALHCPHEDILECPTFRGFVSARLTGRRLRHGERTSDGVLER
jgi:hypothetical protein